MNKTIIILTLALVVTITFSILAFVTTNTQEEISANQAEDESLIEELMMELETEKSKSQELNGMLNLTINEYNELSNDFHKWKNGLLDTPPTPIPQPTILDQEFTIHLTYSLVDNQIIIEGTVSQSHYFVTGTITAGDLRSLMIISAFTLKSDENGFYKKVIEIDKQDSKWQQDSYTLFMKSGEEYKQLKFTL